MNRQRNPASAHTGGARSSRCAAGRGAHGGDRRDCISFGFQSRRFFVLDILLGSRFECGVSSEGRTHTGD